MKVYRIKNIIPQSENWDVRVDGDATQTFEFLAHNLSVTDMIDTSATGTNVINPFNAVPAQGA